MNSWLRYLLVVYHCIGIDECFPRDSKPDGAKVIWETAFFCDQDDEKELFIQILLKSKCAATGDLSQLDELFKPLLANFRHQKPHAIRKLLKEGLASSLAHFETLEPNDQEGQLKGKEENEKGEKRPSLELRKLIEKLVQEQVDDKAAARSCGV